MHLMYGLAEGNASEARRLYAERFPSRHLPQRNTFQRVHERLRETGTFGRRPAERTLSERAISRVEAQEKYLAEDVEN